MTDLVFVDTNILVYACDRAAGAKREHALAALRELWATSRGRISTQVLQEFYVTVTRKLQDRLETAEARDIMSSYGPWVGEPITMKTLVRATEISEIAKLSFWDALIFAAAEEADATILYTEDLNPGQIIAGIKVVNPFDHSTGAGR